MPTMEMQIQLQLQKIWEPEQTHISGSDKKEKDLNPSDSKERVPNYIEKWGENSTEPKLQVQGVPKKM